MPRKTFTAGEVLAASDVNTYLGNQSVMTFASQAARNTAIPTPVAGMIAYLEDTKYYTAYNGSAWKKLALVDDWETYFAEFLAGGTVGNGVWDAGYTQIGDTVHFRAQFTFGTTSSFSGTLVVNFPQGSKTKSFNFYGFASNGTLVNPLIAGYTSSGFSVQASLASGTYVSQTNFAAAVPFTWASGHVLFLSGTYELA